MTISATTQGLRPGTCTSSNRPAVPFDGMMIYETDTNQVAVYDGSGWVYKTADVYPKAGSVLQVVSTTKTDTFSTTSSSFADVTGLSVSITPSSSNSKIFVLASVAISNNSGAAAFVRLRRGTTDIAIGDTAGSRVRVTTGWYAAATTYYPASMSLTCLDSPASTSSQTYLVRLGAQNNGVTVYVNRSDTDTDNATFARGASTITVMEIAQ